jgi:hypothetical protein
VTFSLIGYVMMLSGVAVATLAFGERLPWTVWPAAALVLVALRLLSSPAVPTAARAGSAARSPA